MEDRKHIIAQDSKITIFSAFNDSEFEKYAQISDRYVAVQGKVNNKGFIDVPENATLRDIIDLAGGMYNKAAFNHNVGRRLYCSICKILFRIFIRKSSRRCFGAISKRKQGS